MRARCSAVNDSNATPEIVIAAFARKMADDAADDEGLFAGQNEHQLDRCVRVGSGEIVREANTHSADADVPGANDVERPNPHDVNLDRRLGVGPNPRVLAFVSGERERHVSRI